VELEFTALIMETVTHFSFAALRGTGCPIVLDDDVSGLIDILLRAKPVVGYPKSMADYRPEARFGILFRTNQDDELDLWFSNPLHACAAYRPSPVEYPESLKLQWDSGRRPRQNCKLRRARLGVSRVLTIA
jgi:hypothetical protein